MRMPRCGPVLALALQINDYANFLVLLGSVFVPLTACLLVDYFVGRRYHWDVTEDAPARRVMVVPWLVSAVRTLTRPLKSCS